LLRKTSSTPLFAHNHADFAELSGIGNLPGYGRTYGTFSYGALPLPGDKSPGYYIGRAYSTLSGLFNRHNLLYNDFNKL
jgi:hypothetical protein